MMLIGNDRDNSNETFSHCEELDLGFIEGDIINDINKYTND